MPAPSAKTFRQSLSRRRARALVLLAALALCFVGPSHAQAACGGYVHLVGQAEVVHPETGDAPGPLPTPFPAPCTGPSCSRGPREAPPPPVTSPPTREPWCAALAHLFPPVSPGGAVPGAPSSHPVHHCFPPDRPPRAVAPQRRACPPAR